MIIKTQSFDAKMKFIIKHNCSYQFTYQHYKAPLLEQDESIEGVDVVTIGSYEVDVLCVDVVSSYC